MAVNSATKRRIHIQSETVSVEIDATTSINHNWTSKSTNFPVETGFDVSDHIRVENKKVSISGIITKAKLKVSEGSELLDPEEFEERVHNAISNKELWTISTKHRDYIDYVLNTISLTNKGSDLEISLTFEELRKTATATATFEVALDTDEQIASLTQDIETAKAQEELSENLLDRAEGATVSAKDIQELDRDLYFRQLQQAVREGKI